jgi:signal transduction histidine kinase
MNTTCSTLPTPRVRLPGAERAQRETAAVVRSRDREAAILAGRLIAAQESERHRIARELHDNVGQTLSLLCMEIDGLGAQTGVVPVASRMTGGGFPGGSNSGVGLGLLSMRERVHMTGGRMVIRSVPGQGTRVAVTLPTAPALLWMDGGVRERQSA